MIFSRSSVEKCQGKVMKNGRDSLTGGNTFTNKGSEIQIILRQA
jgi:hypothetical protein